LGVKDCTKIELMSRQESDSEEGGKEEWRRKWLMHEGWLDAEKMTSPHVQ
jgi:hypothetical protein